MIAMIDLDGPLGILSIPNPHQYVSFNNNKEETIRLFIDFLHDHEDLFAMTMFGFNRKDLTYQEFIQMGDMIKIYYKNLVKSVLSNIYGKHKLKGGSRRKIY